ncbi:A24 family peptidase [Pseudonocardia nematodicida]|uniref:A24 family peptidase n=1 Tax=Pseudonocardia nematodicida TaxID=1206997 RepID=A0ABV1K5T0_9PSEU
MDLLLLPPAAGASDAAALVAASLLGTAVPLGAALPLVAAVLCGAAGALAGALTRRWLVRLRRGAPVEPPWCEVGLGVLWAALGVGVAGSLVDVRWAALLTVLSWLTVAGSATDLLRRRLPNALTLPALPLVLLALVPAGEAAVLRGLGGALVLAGAYAVVHLVSPVAMGAGDVKLAGAVGAAVTGPAWASLPVAAVLVVQLSAVVAVVALVSGRAGWRTGLPHGPVLLGSALVVVVAGAGT